MEEGQSDQENKFKAFKGLYPISTQHSYKGLWMTSLERIHYIRGLGRNFLANTQSQDYPGSRPLKGCVETDQNQTTLATEAGQPL